MLLEAARSGDESQVRVHIKEGADVNQVAYFLNKHFSAQISLRLKLSLFRRELSLCHTL